MAVPEVFLAYYKEKAMQGRGLLTGLSNREKRKISDAQRRDMKRAAASETFRAIAADVETFGADRVFSDDSGTTEQV